MDNKELIAALLMGRGNRQLNGPPDDPRIAGNRAAANADELFGLNALQGLIGLNLSPRPGIDNRFQYELNPQNRIQETFRTLPGFY